MEAPRWQRWVLVIAGIYNLVWGAAVVLAPGAAFRLLDMAPPTYPAIWQCVGMIVGVYGIGYLVASRDPYRHWPIVLVGLLGKIFGPIGFLMATSRGELPWSLGWTILTNDLVWWAPFGMILWGAMSDWQRRMLPELAAKLPAGEAMARATIDAGPDAGRSLMDASRDTRQLVVFLRHSGCTFCREALADLRDRRRAIEDSGARIVLAHMTSDASARSFFASYGLDDVGRISDPTRELYQAFDLPRGSFLQLFGPRVFVRGALATLRGHRVGPPDADGFQMPGAFVVRDGRIISGQPHDTAGDRPDYTSLACAVPS